MCMYQVLKRLNLLFNIASQLSKLNDHSIHSFIPLIFMHSDNIVFKVQFEGKNNT